MSLTNKFFYKKMDELKTNPTGFNNFFTIIKDVFIQRDGYEKNRFNKYIRYANNDLINFKNNFFYKIQNTNSIKLEIQGDINKNNLNNIRLTEVKKILNKNKDIPEINIFSNTIILKNRKLIIDHKDVDKL